MLGLRIKPVTKKTASLFNRLAVIFILCSIVRGTALCFEEYELLRDQVFLYTVK